MNVMNHVQCNICMYECNESCAMHCMHVFNHTCNMCLSECNE